MAKFLDKEGLNYFWGKIKNLFYTKTETDTLLGNKADTADLSTKMDKSGPTGTGAFSMNRRDNTTVGPYSSTLGFYNEASGDSSHAEGESNTASGDFSHAEGVSSAASRSCSHAEGRGVYAWSECQHVSGKYNRPDAFDTYAEIIGNGSDDDNRSNARTLDWQGNEMIAGDLSFNGGSDPLSVQLANKQSNLVSGTNIKTINGESVLGSGNITTPNTKPSNIVDDQTGTVELATSGSWTTLKTLTIPAGLYLINWAVNFNSQSGATYTTSTGTLYSYRGAGLGGSQNSEPQALWRQECTCAIGVFTTLSGTAIVQPSSQTTYYLNARQNSSVKLDAVHPRLRYIKLL